jgi:hypothetical protein
VPGGYNEQMLEGFGFHLIEKSDQSIGAVSNASGRLRARNRFREELLELEGQERFELEQQYLETVASLYARGSLSRFAYLAKLK